jgi:fluoroquinolone transport system permease protein
MSNSINIVIREQSGKHEIVKLLKTILWDLKFAARYNIITVAIVITILYTLIFKIIPVAAITEVLITFIFSDPTMLGFIFIGAMVLFEKDANTLQALLATPLKPWQYLWSKAISLTLIALLCSVGMAFIAKGFTFNLIHFITSTALSSLLFAFIGFIGISRVRTFNQYILLIPMFLLPTILPLADLYGLARSPFFYLIPTHGSLILFKTAFEGESVWNIIYAYAILGISIAVTYRIAEKHYLTYISGKTKR